MVASLILAVSLMAGKGPTTLVFSGGEQGPWQQVTANGQILGPVHGTPFETPAGCYGMGRLADGTIWCAAERSFYTLTSRLDRRSGGIVPVETIAGSSARSLYRIRRGAKLRLKPPQLEYAVLLDRIDPRTWTVTQSWAFPGRYSAYGAGHLSVDGADAVAYYATECHPETGAVEAMGVVHRHDLVANVPLPDLVARPVQSGGLHVLAGGSIVVGYTDGVQRFDPDGTHLRTYTAGALRLGQGLIAAGADGSSFWVQGFADGTPYSTLYEFALDGTIRHQWNTPDNGVQWDAPFVDPPTTTGGILRIVDPDDEADGMWVRDRTTGARLGRDDSTGATFDPRGWLAQRTSDHHVFRSYIGSVTEYDETLTFVQEWGSTGLSDPLAIKPTNSAGPDPFEWDAQAAWFVGTDLYLSYHGTTFGNVRYIVAQRRNPTTLALITEWAFQHTLTLAPNIRNIAFTPDASALYYTAQGGSTTDQNRVYKYTFGTGTQSIFVTFGSWGTTTGDLANSVVVAPNGHVIVYWKTVNPFITGDGTVAVYDAAGTLLTSVAVTGADMGAQGRLAADPDSSGVWVLSQTKYTRFTLNSLAIDRTFTVTNETGDTHLDGDLIMSISMACPDPCEDAGLGIPYSAASRGGITEIYDRAFSVVATATADELTVALCPSSQGLWICADDSVGGTSKLRLVDIATGAVLRGGPGEEITVEVRIAELAGAHALFMLDDQCDRMLTVDRATHELISICLPAATNVPAVAYVEHRYGLVVDPLDAQLVDAGDALAYLDGSTIKVWDLVNDVALRTIAATASPLHWLTLLSDNTIAGSSATFLASLGEILRYTRTGTLKQRYTPTNVGFTDGAWGLAADRLEDECSCANPLDGQLWLAEEEPKQILAIDLISGTILSNPILSTLVDNGDTAAAFTVLNVATGAVFSEQTGPIVRRPTPNHHCGDEGKLSTVASNPGCNPGGNGWVRDYTGASGVVPTCADPTPGTSLLGKTGLVVWAEHRHTSYPSLAVGTMRIATIELDDTTRKEGRIHSIGNVEIGLSGANGDFISANIHLERYDADGHPIAIMLGDTDLQYFQRDELMVWIMPDEARRSGGTPVAVGRGFVNGHQFGGMLIATFDAIDSLMIEGGGFSPDKKIPQYNFPRAFYASAPVDLAQRSMPIIVGEVSDEGAVNRLSGLTTPRGKCPVRWVGEDGLGTGPGGQPWHRFNVCMFAIYKIIALYGSDLGGLGLYGRAAMASLQVNDTIWTLDSLLAPVDLTGVATDGTALLVTFLPTGRTEFVITAAAGSTVTVDGTIDPSIIGQPISWFIAPYDYVPKRVKIDLATRNGVDTMVFGYPGYIRSTTYEEFTSIDGDYRVTDIWVRGPLAEEHLAGGPTLTVNAIGVEDQGDGTGLPYTDYFTCYNWIVDNLLQRQLRAPLGGLWPQTNGQVPVFSDGFSRTKQSSFAAAQALTVLELGGNGLQMSAWFGEGTSTRDVEQLLENNGGCRSYIDEYGRFGVWRFNPFEDSSVWPRIEHVSRVFGDVRTIRAIGEAMNTVRGGCDYEPDAGMFREDDMSAVSPSALVRNENIPRYSKHIDGKLIADKTHFQYLLNRTLAMHSDGPIYVEIDSCDAALLNVPVGTGILFTSLVGPGANGYVDQPLIILRRNFDVNGLTASLVCLNVGDPNALLIPSAQQFILTNNPTGPILSNTLSSIAPVLAA